MGEKEREKKVLKLVKKVKEGGDTSRYMCS